MSIDNSTGKDKGFYDKGQTIFDRIPGKEMKEQSLKLSLDLYESGTLCHALLGSMMASSGGFDALPLRIRELYLKLTKLNDKLMGK